MIWNATVANICTSFPTDWPLVLVITYQGCSVQAWLRMRHVGPCSCIVGTRNMSWNFIGLRERMLNKKGMTHDDKAWHLVWSMPSKALGIYFPTRGVFPVWTPYRFLVNTKVEDLEVEDLLCNDLRWGMFRGEVCGCYFKSPYIYSLTHWITVRSGAGWDVETASGSPRLMKTHTPQWRI